MELVFIVNGATQRITRTDANKSIADSVKFLTAVFTVTGMSGMVVTPLFKKHGVSYIPEFTHSETDGVITINCIVPSEVIKYSGFDVSIFGYNTTTEERITVDTVTVPVEKSGYDEGQGVAEPSTTVYEQILQALSDCGKGITTIVKTSTEGLVDTYTITYTDLTTDTFTVTNGTVGADGRGIVSINKTGTVDLVDTYTISYSDGTTSTFTVTNGDNLTAEELLAQIETVDGPGSGLDADLLDGYNSSQSATASTVAVRNAHGAISANSLILSTTPDVSAVVNGETYYNTDLMVFETRLPDGTIYQHGQELTVTVINDSGAIIPDGTIVYWSSAVGSSGLLKVKPFTASGTIESQRLIGLSTDALAIGSKGKITGIGMVNGIDTTGTAVGETWAEGTVLYANPSVAGAMTSVKPSAPNNVIRIGVVIRAHATTGIIYVRPTYQDNSVNIRKAITVSGGTATQAMVPNVLYVFRGALDTLTLTIIAETDETISAEYRAVFTAGTSGTVITWPAKYDSTHIIGDTTTVAGMSYEINMSEDWAIIKEMS